MQMYCVKCRAQREANEVKDVTTSNGRKAKQAICSSCGTKMFKFVSG